ncbi:MlaD family protein [Patulibacter minatonensis]|uniref:MlaD family protein n=1 Tax=Patulibacter minatonensis TaxID=298163 RepID=UPI0005657C3F|nr:MCE family protein [Patulibacter minatonensis]
MSPRIRRRLTGGLVLLVLVALVLVTRSGDSDGQKDNVLVATVKDATNVVPGQYIRAAGQIVGEVGTITPTEKGRSVKVELRFKNEVWPVRRGAKLQLRWGGTVSYNNRYLAYTPGPAGGAELQADAGFPAKDITVPVEFDQLLATFDKKTRKNVTTFVTNAGGALKPASEPLHEALEDTPAALEQTSALLRDVEGNRAQLAQLIDSADRVVGAAREANPDLRALVTGGAQTVNLIRGDAKQVQATLDKVPGTLDKIRTTLPKADTTLAKADDVTRRLDPGITELRGIAKPLDRTLGTLADVAPKARRTLATVAKATPDVNTLLAKATSLAPTITGIGRQGNPQLNCIRPYTPEIVSFPSNWADVFSWTDHKDKYIRANVQNIFPAAINASSSSSGDLTKLFPGLKYAFPFPPGYLADQPWYLPECHITKDSFDASKDPEAGR